MPFNDGRYAAIESRQCTSRKHTYNNIVIINIDYDKASRKDVRLHDVFSFSIIWPARTFTYGARRMYVT